MDGGGTTIGEEADRLAGYGRHVLAMAEALPRDTLERRYRLPFLELDARFTDATYAAHCDGCFATVPTGGPAASVALSVIDAETGGISRPLSWWEPVLAPFAFEQRLARAGLHGSYFHDDRVWQFYDAAERRGVALMPAPGAYPPWERSAPLRPFLHWIYAEMGMRLVHAATLGAKGRGILIAGQGGAGKSGTTLAGILGGLDSVGDDYVLLDLRGRPTAFPVFRIVKQDGEGLRRLGLSPADLGPINWQGKVEFDLERLGGGRLAPSLEIGAIIVPSVAHAPRSRIEPIRPREAMLALAPSGIFQMPGERRDGPAFFAEAVRRLPCYRIELGTDGTEIAGALAAFIEGLP